ncbi:MAG: conjugal transfer protein TraX [Treponema sp.]|nr:conjugal transfer protein TraX [Treponema sp.]
MKENSLENTETRPLPAKNHKWHILSGNGIKIIGVILMAMDHLHQMFTAQGAPAWLSWFGRPVAVMFVFLCAEGFHYTRNKKRYMLQLLIGFLFMSVMNRLLTVLIPLEDIMLINNIFSALLMAVFYMAMIDLLRRGLREKKAGTVALAAGGMLLPLLAGLAFVAALMTGNLTAVEILTFVPNPITAEGGLFMVGMGILFYVLRKHRLAQIGAVLIVSIFSWYTGKDPAAGNYQWLMVFAVIPMFLYNGTRGRGSKYFFYVFYPAHIYLFYIVARLIR